MSPEQIGQFFGQLCGWPARRKLAGVFTAYFDESGTHESPAFTLAGIIAPSPAWDTFSAEWLAAMEDGGAGGKTLHMKHLLQGTKGKTEDEDFTGWTEPMRKRLFALLAPIVSTHAAYGYAATVPVRDFDEILREGPRPLQITPVVFCMKACLDMIVRTVQPTESDPLACIFHRNDALEPQMVSFYKGLRRERGWERILPASSPTFVPARGFPPIQALDMFARESNDFWLQKEIAASGRKRRALFDELTKARKLRSAFYPRALLLEENAKLEHLKATLPQKEFDGYMDDLHRARTEMQQERDPNHRKPRKPQIR